MKEKIQAISKLFGINGEFVTYEQITSGHINTTYKVTFYKNSELVEYVLQSVNTYVFKNPVEVMENIDLVTDYVSDKAKRGAYLKYLKALDGNLYTYYEDGSFWRCSEYINNSVTYLNLDSYSVIESAGEAFGGFQLLLDGFPVEKLNIVIPHFHNTENRYKIFKEAIKLNKSGRAESVADEIKSFLDFEDVATAMYRMQKAGELPLRVTHNDTKCSNVLFDKETAKSICVIDLDTVMPGLMAFDFGDSIRIVGSTGAEDERNLDNVRLDMGKYEAFTKGFVSKVKDTLTENEKRTLAYGALTMTVECGMRFLTDYIDGDKYFRVEYPEHNLVRARTHIKLATDMLAKMDEMKAIVDKYL